MHPPFKNRTQFKHRMLTFFDYVILKSEKTEWIFSIKRKNAVFGEIHNGNLWVNNWEEPLLFNTESFDALNIFRS